jgi:RimJ/RimL family protein N-acetyltransferase
LQPSIISTPRLELWPMTTTFLQACLEASRMHCGPSSELDVPLDWLEETDLMQMRLAEFREDPAYAGWGLHAVRIAGAGPMIGHVGFHSLPDAEYLHPYWPDAVELSYATYPPYRRLGYAAEAVAALLRWAARRARIRRFLLTVSASNRASRGLAGKLGFVLTEQYPIGDGADEDQLLYVLQGESLDQLVHGTAA